MIKSINLLTQCVSEFKAAVKRISMFVFLLKIKIKNVSTLFHKLSYKKINKKKLKYF